MERLGVRDLADGAGTVHGGLLPGPSGNECPGLHRGPPVRRRSAHTRAGCPRSPALDRPYEVVEPRSPFCGAGLPRWAPRASSHPDSHRRCRSSTGSAVASIAASGGYGASGSRTVTAGSDFHRPRSTLLTARVQRRSLHGHCGCGDRRCGPPQPQSWTAQGAMMIHGAVSNGVGRLCP